MKDITESTLHAEKMDLVRTEFNRFWDDELHKPWMQSLNHPQRLHAQTSAWRAYLSAKGLLK